MKKIITAALLLAIALVLSMCGKKDEHAHTQEAATKYTCPMDPQIIQDKPGPCPICGMDLVKINASTSDQGTLMLSESQVKLANINTMLTQYESMGANTILTGKLVVSEEQASVVSSRVEGRIERLFFKEEGQRVEQNQPLYEIYSESLLTLQREYLLALRQLEELKDPRYESFLKASEKKLLLLGMTQAQVRGLAQRKSTESRMAFLAPASGVISRIDATEGQYVSQGSALYRIDKLDQVWVEAELYPGESLLVKMGDVVRVQINGYENSPVEGKVTFLSPEYRQGTQIITVRVVIANPKRLFFPGMQANVILSHSKRKAIGLPSEAVIRDAHGSHVWILENDGSFKPRVVKTGLENMERVEITQGLDEKENVVISGAYLLYSEWVLKKGGDIKL